MVRYRKLSVALLLYTTILCITEVFYDVTADETTAVQDTVPGTPESPNSSTTADLDRPEDIEESTSRTAESQGFYQRYKQFVVKHNKTFTIVLGVLSGLLLVGALVACCVKGGEMKEYVAFLIIPIVFWMGLFGYMVYKLYGNKVMAFFKNKKAAVVKSTVDSTG
ncbi:putative integral membrane protein [Babesia bovis T2Bo]|uniref:Uncharacterized protein n=1 Tax=Babesia bovis TaxID=5865 RepID=A7AUW8_BABBO|nr:putative integral membrane protein [Babesia bovis T2Bo]EDO06729.1 putative integral membrane protein [Babesia bovis T2Bo]|eukprot:XP_001610297.1 hypothetical protein [Babesia bovis T2Bo]